MLVRKHENFCSRTAHHVGRRLHSRDERWIVRHPHIPPEPEKHGLEGRCWWRARCPAEGSRPVAAHDGSSFADIHMQTLSCRVPQCSIRLGVSIKAQSLSGSKQFRRAEICRVADLDCHFMIRRFALGREARPFLAVASHISGLSAFTGHRPFTLRCISSMRCSTVLTRPSVPNSLSLRAF